MTQNDEPNAPRKIVFQMSEMTEDDEPIAPKESIFKRVLFGIFSVFACIIAVAAVGVLNASLQGHGGSTYSQPNLTYLSDAQKAASGNIFLFAIFLWSLATGLAWNALKGIKPLQAILLILSIGLLVIVGGFLGLRILLASGPAM